MTAIESQLATALRDQYVLERELGRGGMATVYLARDLRHQRYVALKVLNPELASAVGLERFLREIRVAASLQHPHILPVHDSGESAGLLWYTMPYVEGESLRERLRHESRLGIDEAVSLAWEVADALECAHAAGVVHRDIKPENILLSRGHALVADFGIARAIHEAGETLTYTGVAVGTPAYMSPEQAVASSAGPGSDIYSLGCVLYEMLVGERPFSAPTPQAMIARRLLDTPPDLRLARPAVPAALAAVVARTLAINPLDRFATAAQFAAALRASALTPTSEGLPSAGGPPSRFPGRRMAVVAASLLLFAGGAAWFIRRSPAHSPLDATLLAVAPFDVLDPTLGLWHEGLMDVFSRTLDGIGPLRTVPPTVIARRWSGRSDRGSASRLAHATNAAIVLYGAVVPAGPDSVRLTASLLDARNQQAMAEFDMRGPRDRLDRLADSLTLVVIRALAPPTGLAPSAGSPVGTTSHAALKAFLKGEQHYRRSEFDSARASFRKAVRLDSGFAIAWHRLSYSIDWQDSTESLDDVDPEITAAAFRAARIHGQSVRDSLLLTADSLFRALPQLDEPLDDRFWTCHTRLFTTLEEATRKYPEDPEVVLALAEAGWQWGGFTGRPFDEILGLYDRAIALDSAFTPSYVHAMFLALAVGDPTRALHYIEAHLRSSPSASLRGSLVLMQELLDPVHGDRAVAERLLDSLPVSALTGAFGQLAMSADSGEAVIRVLRALAERDTLRGPRWDFPLGIAIGARGRMREMIQFTRRAPWILPYAQPLAAPLLPPDTLQRYRSMWSRTKEPWNESPPPFLSWLSSQGDTALLAHLVVVYRGRVSQPLVRAFLSLARRDTAAAVARFLALPDSDMVMWLDPRLTKAQLLRATGHFQEAALTLRPSLYPYASNYLPGDALWHLERGRVYEKLGDQSGARRAYQTVVDLWRHADPELQPFVAEARDALVRIAERSR